MSCSRCSGFMLEDHFLDFEGSSGEFWSRSWRCVNCGHVHDAVIERNRLALREKVLGIHPANRTIRMTKSLLAWDHFHRLAA
jgi:hypothetical protein